MVQFGLRNGGGFDSALRSAAEERSPSQCGTVISLIRCSRLALLCLLSLLISLLRRCLLGLLACIGLYLVGGHGTSRWVSSLDRHRPELAGGICGETVREIGT